MGSSNTFFRISYQRIQNRGDDLLCRDVVNEQEHPGAQGFNGGQCIGELPLGSRQFLDLCPINRFQKLFSRGEVAIQGPRSDARLPGDVVQAGIGPRTCERLLRDSQNAFTIPLRVNARFSFGRL